MATHIYCPVCSWRPGPHDRWACAPGCLTVWNTFETRARCPGCAKQWRTTACLACHLPSPHAEWYHDEAPGAGDAESAAREREEAPARVGSPQGE